MRNLLFTILVVLFAAPLCQAETTITKKDVLGEWKFESTYAPYGYDKGTILFQEKEKDITGHIKFADGTKVDIKSAKIEEGALKFSITVEYYDVPIKATVEKGILKGAASTPEGNINFEAKKVVPEKKN